MDEKEFDYKFTKDESQKILNAVAKEPFNEVYNIVNKIQLQFAEQNKNEEAAGKNEEVLNEDTNK